MPRSLEVDCCVAGGGPAGVMAGLLFARAGCKILVLEKHADFLRDFRGDTVHPSTLEVMHELGLLDEFLERPHQKLSKLSAVFSGERLDLTDFSSIDATCKFIVFMPQWHFLDFLTEAANRYPTFSIEMQAEVTDLIEQGGRVVGVRAETPHGPLEVRSRLVIGADGRSSRVRDCAGLEVEKIGAPIDVLWFHVPRTPANKEDEPLLNTTNGQIIITINRGDYYQCAIVVPKGGADGVRAQGLTRFREIVAESAPRLADGIESLQSFDDVKLLTVEIDRLRRWSRPGLLMIGDAAHAMSPVGGVGINLAIQDAVAAANLLAGPLADGTLEDADLAAVRKRRLWPVRVTQGFQTAAQNRIITKILEDRQPAAPPPLALRLVSRIPWLGRRLAAFVGIGVLPEHVRSPDVFGGTEAPAG